MADIAPIPSPSSSTTSLASTLSTTSHQPTSPSSTSPLPPIGSGGMPGPRPFGSTKNLLQHRGPGDRPRSLRPGSDPLVIQQEDPHDKMREFHARQQIAGMASDFYHGVQRAADSENSEAQADRSIISTPHG
jgi:hypothetical protein